MHGVEGSLSRSALPAAHAEQFVADSAEYMPTVHVLHAVAGDESRSAVPCSHGLHAVCPAAAS